MCPETQIPPLVGTFWVHAGGMLSRAILGTLYCHFGHACGPHKVCRLEGPLEGGERGSQPARPVRFSPTPVMPLFRECWSRFNPVWTCFGAQSAQPSEAWAGRALPHILCPHHCSSCIHYTSTTSRLDSDDLGSKMASTQVVQGSKVDHLWFNWSWSILVLFLVIVGCIFLFCITCCCLV